MSKKLFLLVTATVVGVFALAVQPAKPPKRGTDILHLFLTKKMVNEGLVTNASGSVKLGQNRQGNANNQRLDISTSKLQTNTTYQLYAVLGDDTNFTYAGSFTTPAKGRASVRFMKVGSSNGKGPGKGKTVLPAVLDPISNIRSLMITDMSTQAVLSAELREPEKLQYLIKRGWSEGSATADLRLQATTRKVKFQLQAWGLTPATNYFLALNSQPVTSAASKTNGTLKFTSIPVMGTNILDLHTVAIWDSASNSVLSTTLP